MIQPIVGIRLNNKKFISLLNAAGTDSKTVILYKNDFEDGEIPVYTCKMKTENKIEKIYKIGALTLPVEVFEGLAFDAEEKSDNDVVQIVSSLKKDGKLSIYLNTGRNKKFIPQKLYETNVYEELELQNIQEKDTELLDYGDFIKCSTADAALLPEEDLSQNSVLKEKESQNSLKKKKNSRKSRKEKRKERRKEKKNSPDYYEYAREAEETPTSLAGKLLVFTAIVLMIAVGSIIYLFSTSYKAEAISKQKDFAQSINYQITHSLNETVKGIKTDALTVLKLDDENILKSFFASHNEIIAVIYEDKKIINTEHIRLSGIAEEKIQYALNGTTAASVRAKYEKTCIKNVSHILGKKTAIMYIPVEKRKVCAVIFATDSFEEVCLSNPDYTIFVIDKSGCLISGYDPVMVSKNENLSGNALVDLFLNGGEEKDVENKTSDDSFYGIYEYIENGEFAVMTIARTKIFLNPIEYVSEEAVFLCVLIFTLALIIIWSFGQRISTGVKALTTGTEKIKRGQFNLRLTTSRRDELGELTRAFVDMGHSLEAREKVKKVLGKYADESLISKIEKGELKISGENKFSTVMFIGIRNFKLLSKRFRPEEILVFMNKYYSFVENIIRRNGGYVDKISGDTLMAIFGAPESSGTPKQDAINAVRSALKIRHELVDFNAELEQNNKPSIRIGCGINSGTVVAGQLGSDFNCSYTCIGDIVSIAKSAEKLNRKHETTVLISEATHKLVTGFFNTEEISDYLTCNDEKETKLYSVIEEVTDEE